MPNEKNHLSDELHKAIITAAGAAVAGWAQGNKCRADKLGQAAADVYAALAEAAGKNQGAGPKPFVPAEDSVKPDYIVCLEDGRRLKMLKRYLKTRYGMTGEEYREKWGLSRDYPMVAPNYAKKRSKLAKSAGLGKK
ncbi:MAG: MucR family transcriptional regulator [Rickettsiales bacterium]|jgi:predicted transcriptional regulator|nr:MucR family transcriptional regulator [Rickettsiales bacterium]